MTTASKEKWAKAEGAMMAELRPVLMLLKADYEAASKIHIPNWKGGPNAGILAELVCMGWRKPEANMFEHRPMERDETPSATDDSPPPRRTRRRSERPQGKSY
jgi:hypothetical protein